MSSFRAPVAAALASLISVQTGAAFAKSIFPAVGSDGVAALRVGIATLLLGVAMQPWRLFPLANPRDLRNLIAYGSMLGLMNLLIYRSFAYIPIGVAISIEVAGPLGAALLSSRRALDWLWVAIAAFGLALLPLGSITGPLDWRGVAFALAAALCWGIYVGAGSRIAHLGGPGVAAGMAFASLFVVPFGIVHAGSRLLDAHVLLFGTAVAVLSSALPFLLDIYALARLPRSVFGVLMSASPAAGALAGFLVVREVLSVTQCLGIVAISIACACSAAASKGASKSAAA